MGLDMHDESEKLLEADNALKEALDMFLRTKPKGISTWITAKGVYKIDHNYNPPRVTKIEEKQNGEER